jgi:hypothetical protein
MKKRPSLEGAQIGNWKALSAHGIALQLTPEATVEVAERSE